MRRRSWTGKPWRGRSRPQSSTGSASAQGWRSRRGELGKGVARPALLAPMVRQLERGDGKAHEAQARGEKPHLLTHLPEPLGDAVGEDAELAHAPVEVDAREEVEDTVEEPGAVALG